VFCASFELSAESFMVVLTCASVGFLTGGGKRRVSSAKHPVSSAIDSS
jgi:hypothetical protein